MPRTLAAIRVIIEDGSTFKYPDFNQLAVVKTFIAANPGKDWSNYVDLEGTGFKYDNAGGADRDDGETPVGQWCAHLLIPVEFARQAVLAFPRVSRVTEAELQVFYDTRHAAEFPDEDIDLEILQKIKLKQDLGLPLTNEQAKAIDPLDDTRGIRKSKRKSWVDHKQEQGLVIDERP